MSSKKLRKEPTQPFPPKQPSKIIFREESIFSLQKGDCFSLKEIIDNCELKDINIYDIYFRAGMFGECDIFTFREKENPNYIKQIKEYEEEYAKYIELFHSWKEDKAKWLLENQEYEKQLHKDELEKIQNAK